MTTSTGEAVLGPNRNMYPYSGYPYSEPYITKTVIPISQKIEIMQAFEHGHKIQKRTNYVESGIAELIDRWEDDENPTWDWNTFEYRVKPEVEIIPYESSKQFVEAARVHGPYFRSSLGEHACYFHASSVEGLDVTAPDHAHKEISFKELAKDFVWQDGTPMGIDTSSLLTIHTYQTAVN